MWHLEVESLLVLKNNRGVEDNRVRKLDYAVQINKTLLTRLIKNQHITLFSPNEVPGLYEAFFSDQEEFERLYTQYEADASIRKKQIPAIELFSSMMQERASTGRIYIHFVDHSNTHSPFNPKKAPIHMSNLCVAGDTLITIKDTSNGEPVHTQIANKVNEWVKVWNGVEWTDAYVVCTSKEPKKLYPVKLRIYRKDSAYSKDVIIYATEEHRWFVKGKMSQADELASIEKRTFELEAGDLMTAIFRFQNGLGVNDEAIVLEIDKEGYKEEPTYCYKEPKTGKAIFNGLLTGQCVEIALPTVPLNDVKDPEGELALCVLAAVNVGETSIEEMPAVTDILVRFLDALLDYQDYAVPAAAHSTLTRRPLGIGIINYAYWLTKQGIRMSDDEAAPVTHTLMEHLQYSAMKASVELAKEKGRCPGFDDLVLKDGILPIDTYKRDIDKFAPPIYECDWESLREEIKEHGIRNSTLTAMMPSESSSQVSNATNGIEPPRSLVTVKASKDGILKQVVPEILRLGLEYETLWELKDMEHYFRLMAVIQKFTCQSISTNTSYDPKRYPGEKVPMTVLLKDLTTAYKYGLKTLYYHHTRDGADDRQGDIDDDGCAGGACKI